MLCKVARFRAGAGNARGDRAGRHMCGVRTGRDDRTVAHPGALAFEHWHGRFEEH